MESSADYAWAFAVVGGPILLALVVGISILRTRRKPKAAREADAPRSYSQRSQRTGDGRRGT
ncbi:MAG: hypothetical protein ACJ8H8_09805 [Geminicoccaceae bacterium]